MLLGNLLVDLATDRANSPEKRWPPGQEGSRTQTAKRQMLRKRSTNKMEV